MQTQTFPTPDEAIAFATELQNKGFIVNAHQLSNGTSIVRWIPKQKYIDHDGVERDEEVWVTRDNGLINVADLSPEHARNIIRMILRQDREAQQAYNNALTQIADALETAMGGAPLPEEEEDEQLSTMPGAPTLDSILNDDVPPGTKFH